MNNEQLLVLYFDGELDELETQEVEMRLQTDTVLSTQLEELITLRDQLRLEIDSRVAECNFTQLSDRVMASIEKLEPLKIPDQRKTSPPEENETQGMFTQFKSWLAKNATPLLIGAALACALLFGLRILTPLAKQSSVKAPVGSTVLINLQESEEAESAPVIWVLDDEDIEEDDSEDENPI